jgi:hypothetical protein
MPAKEIDYSTTVIYKIVCNDLAITDLYVGFTTNFRLRKSQHKSQCKYDTKKAEYKIYKTIKENGGWLNWSMVQIEAFPCANGNEARARERHWYEQLNANLNMEYPNRSQKEYYGVYYEQNVDKIKECQTRYREKNKDKLKEYNKNYYIENNRKEYNKLYEVANKDKIKERRSQPYTCECGSVFKIGKKSQHFKTLKHQAFIAQKDNIEI